MEDACLGERRPERRHLALAVPSLLVCDVLAGIADEHDRDERTGERDRQRAGPDDRARRDGRRERAAREGRRGETEVAGRLVQAERESAARPAGEVDLHHDRHRPRETLVYAEEQVREDDHPPALSESDQQGHGQGKQPAGDEQPLAACAVGERTGGEVRQRLGGAEGDDEREDRGVGAETEVLLADERQDAPLEADQRPDERVQANEEGELRRVRPQPEANRARSHRRTAAAPRLFAATISAWSAGGGGTSTRSARANDSASSSSSARLF